MREAFSIADYDPQRHITAGELRALGFLVCENVEDADYVRRVAVGVDPRQDLDDGSPSLALLVLERFAKSEELCFV